VVDVARNPGTDDYCVTIRPNWASRADHCCAVFAVLIPACSLISVVCLLGGAWPVVPFFVLAMVGLGCAFQRMRIHAGDFERLTLQRGRLTLERHVPDREQRFEFNSAWVQVVGDASGRSSLLLRAHGREIPFGALLTDEERVAIGGELRGRLAHAGG
jgi:uncharacterized membrane protein